MPLVPWPLDRRDEGARMFAVRPREVQASPGEHPTQWRRTLACNLWRPIHLVEHRGRWTALDGLHRLLKATVLGRETIPAVRPSPELRRPIFVEDPG